ncbi:MAG: serine/threonine-protein kinase [Planctomycetota bacterium]|nr:serine/threonine-protein kinase [Planctomycetota bacterium]
MTNLDQPFPDYELLDRVGGGAMGTVFKARHKRLNRIVALKILKPSLARDKRYVERLRREARIVASLSHPHIVTGYDLGEEGGYHFFVMEFVEGKSLRQLLVEWGMFAEEYVLRVAREVAEALDHAYQRDVIHRDIKPGNILIDDSGRVKLTDMGLAKGPADLTLTRDGATVGTPMYISPEQARNPQDVDVRSDLYSLGATLYHMSTGVPPFAGNTMAELITNVLSENVVPPDEANAAVSPGLSLVIRKLLAKNLTARYQTPRDLLDDLDRLDRALPPTVDAARLDAAADLSSRWARPLLVGVGALLLALGAWWVGRQMVEPRVMQPDSQQFLAALDRELARLPSAGARHLRLSTVVDAPSGSMQPLEQRRQQVAAELQDALDGVVDVFDEDGRRALIRWLRDAKTWPDAARFERDRLLPQVRRACGVSLAQLPVRVRRERVEGLRAFVRQQLGERDAELVARFDQYVAETVAGRARGDARLGRFAAAAGHWLEALAAFCDGVSHPQPERLGQDVRSELARRLAARSEPALAALRGAERGVAVAMRDHVAGAVEAIRAGLDDRGAAPELARESLQRLRANLRHFWPDEDAFEVGIAPWPEVEQLLMVAEQDVEQRLDERRVRRFEGRCDTAWRAYRYGDAAAALAVLVDAEPATDAQRRALAGHRRCLKSVLQVERAMLRAVADRTQGTIGFLSGSAEPFALRVEPVGERLRVFGDAVDQPARAMQLTELRIDNLLQALGPLRGVASGPRQLGVTVLRLAADDTGGAAAAIEAMGSADRSFVLDQVAPRIERARGRRADAVSVDVDSLLAMLASALEGVERGGSHRELTRALLRLESRPLGALTSAQERTVRRARKRRDLALREDNLLSDLRADAPLGARVDVRVDDDALAASVSWSAESLQAGAGDGWQLRDDVLEFAGSARPFDEQPQLALRGAAGAQVQSKRARLAIEWTFPKPAVGDRSYLLAFRGVSMVVVLAANDSVHVELIDGDAMDEERARRAYAAALAGAFAPARATAVPGALHRMTVDVAQVAPNQASVRVMFEGEELLRRLHRFDPKQPVAFALHPRQEVAVRAVDVTIFGL